LVANTVSFALADGQYIQYHENYDSKGPCIRIQIGDQNIARAVARAISDSFTVISNWEAKAAGLSEAQNSSFQFAEKTIAAFAAEAAKLSQTSADSMTQLHDAMRKLSIDIEKEYQGKRASLETEYSQMRATLEKEIQGKNRDLDEREKAHREDVKRFELRNNTVIRRQLLGEIRAAIKTEEEVKVPKGTEDKRQPVHNLCIGTIVLAVTL